MPLFSGLYSACGRYSPPSFRYADKSVAFPCVQNTDTKTSGSEGGSEAETGSPVSGVKREREEDDQFDDYFKIQSSIFEELTAIMNSVDPNDVTALARAIRDARVVCCYGVGREGLVMKGLASNLHHMGFDAHVVGDTNTPTLGKGDLFLVSAGPSYYSTVSASQLCLVVSLVSLAGSPQTCGD